jgi:hypothetical protein
MVGQMKGLAALLVVVTLAASACGSGHHARQKVTSGLHGAAYRALPQSLRVFIRSTLAKSRNGPTQEVDVYGPGTHAALEQAAMGDIVNDPDRKKDFYLIVQHGRYVCSDCSGPARAKPPHGTFETTVWSPKRGGTDWGLAGGLPASMSSLHPIAVITLS